MAYRVSVRSGGSVLREKVDGVDEALAWVERAAREAADGPRLAAVDLRARRFEPEDQIAARAELAGPQRWRPDVRAGLDVHGDGSVVAWTGGVNRAAIEEARDESAYAALRRVVQSTSVEP